MIPARALLEPVNRRAAVGDCDMKIRNDVRVPCSAAHLTISTRFMTSRRTYSVRGVKAFYFCDMPQQQRSRRRLRAPDGCGVGEIHWTHPVSALSLDPFLWGIQNEKRFARCRCHVCSASIFSSRMGRINRVWLARIGRQPMGRCGNSGHGDRDNRFGDSHRSTVECNRQVGVFSRKSRGRSR